jgi:hypothetical protein
MRVKGLECATFGAYHLLMIGGKMTFHGSSDGHVFGPHMP